MMRNMRSNKLGMENEVKREFCIYERISPEFYAFREINLIGKFEIFEVY